MTTKTSTYPLRLPRSLKAAVEKLSKEDGTSVNQFVVMAVAEKVSALTTADVFRRAQGARRHGGVRPHPVPRRRRAAPSRRRVAEGLTSTVIEGISRWR